jgi:hypothetical protein
MKKILLSVFATALMAFGANAQQSLYLAPAGDDTANDCLDPLNPCATITHAVSQAIDGDTIVLALGNYTFSATQQIDKSVYVTSESSTNKPVITATTADVINVSAPDVTITGLRLEMGLSVVNGLRGIVALSNFDNLVIDNNEIISIKFFSTGMIFNAFGIYAQTNTQPLNITITNNSIQPLDALRDAFGRCIGLGGSTINSPGGLIQNNDLAGFYPIQSIGNRANLSVDNNNLVGGTLIGYPANGVTIDITNNTFDGFNDFAASNILAMLELRAINNNGNVNVEDNEFINYKNIGLFSSASRNVMVKNNTFQPSPTADAFISIAANSKLQTTGNQNTNFANKIEIMGNTFEPGVANTGTAISYADHFGVTSPAFEDTIMVGGPNQADKNVFNPDIQYYIALDSLSGPSDQVAYWATYPVTNMVPFSQMVWALIDNNEYNIVDMILLEEKMLDSLDNNSLGRVYLVPPTPTSSLVRESGFEIYPNPVKDILVIRNKELHGISRVIVFDINGRQVANEQMNAIGGQATLNLDYLPAGYYTVQVENNAKFFRSKLVKE